MGASCGVCVFSVVAEAWRVRATWCLNCAPCLNGRHGVVQSWPTCCLLWFPFWICGMHALANGFVELRCPTPHLLRSCVLCTRRVGCKWAWRITVVSQVAMINAHDKGQDTLRIHKDLEGGIVAHLVFGARGSLNALGVGTGGDAATCILVNPKPLHGTCWPMDGLGCTSNMNFHTPHPCA
jgi:hypothetical protein